MALAKDINLKDGDLVFREDVALRDGWRKQYELTRTILFEVDAPGSGIVVKVPAGYVTDSYSLPGLFRFWMPENNHWKLPAVVHDWLYAVGQCQRSRADEIFLQAMRAVGVKRRHSWAAYLGVRMGGQVGFGKIEPINREMVMKAREQGIHDGI